MKILFSMRHFGFVRMYETVLRDLADRGHTVVVAGEQRQAPGTLRNVEELAKAHPSIEWSHALTPTHDLWYDLSRVVRLWLDYLRFFRPEYDSAPKLRARAEEQMPRAIVKATARAPFCWPAGRRLLERMLGAIERAIPSNAGVDRFLAEQRPDVVLLTPLVYLGSAQVEVLKSAKALGLRTGLCVGSWDHLSSKAFIRDLPDRVFVWNDTQKREAVELHGVPAARVVVTGAQCYDHWFDRRPSRSREAFCASVGLPADRPFILYVCSALFLGSPSEAEFVSEWAARVRADEDPTLRDASILIRPHPARSDDWARVDLSGMPNVAVTPPANPVDEATRGDYFDALYYSHAVVGLNTSAFLEAGLLGKPVFSLLLPRFRDNQEGTLHFHYLTQAGLLRTSRSFDAHMADLRAILAGASSFDGNASFVESFIRPCGRAATPVFVEAVQAMGDLVPAAAAQAGAVAGLKRLALYPVARLSRRVFSEEEQLLATDRVTRTEVRARERESRLAEGLEKKSQLEAESRRAHEEKVRQTQAARQAREQEKERARQAEEARKTELRQEKARLKDARVRDKSRRVAQARRQRVRQEITRRLGLLFARGRGVR